MPDDDKNKIRKAARERGSKVPPTGAKTNSAVEPDDDYELDIGEDE